MLIMTAIFHGLLDYYGLKVLLCHQQQYEESYKENNQ